MNYLDKIEVLKTMIDSFDLPNADLIKDMLEMMITYSAIDKQEIINLIEDEQRKENK